MPLVGAAWLPWWTVAGLTLALAVTHREGSEAREVRTPLLLLGGLAGLAALLPGLRGAAGAVTFAHLFLLAAGGTALTLLAVTALEDRRAGWGAGWLAALLLPGALLPGVSAPGLGVGLLALVLALLGAPGAEERPGLRLPGRGAAWRVAGAAGLAAALLALLALALPGTGGPEGGRASPPPPPTVSDAGQVQDPSAAAGSSGAASPLRRRAPVSGVILPGADLVLVGGVLLLLSVAFLMWRAGGRLRAGQPPRPWEVVAVLGLLVAAGLTLAFGAAAGTGGTGGGLEAGGAASPGDGGVDTLGAEPASLSARLARWVWWLSLLSFLVLAALAGAVLWLAWRLRSPSAPGEAPAAPSPIPTPPGEEEALHRVRAAYRSALAALEGAGLARSGDETPAEHAARVAGTRPGLAAPLNTLVAAYAPVRYGGRLTDEDAAAAEEAAREIGRFTAGGRPGPDAEGTP